MKLVFLISFLLFNSSLTNAQTTIFHPEAIPIVLERVSPVIMNLPQSAESAAELSDERMEHENPSLEYEMPITNPNARPVGADPDIQKEKTIRDSTVVVDVLSSWEGMAANIEPSDNCLAVGPDHVMQMVNNYLSTFIRIWDKTGNIFVDYLKVKDFSGINDCGDPNIIYDQLADRYVLVLLYSCSTSKLEVCVSQTEDPTGSWYIYSFTTSGGFPDYPKIGMWGDSYFITTNSNSPTIWALDRASLLAGSPFGFVQKFSLSSFPSLGFQSSSPVNFTGTNLPPTGSPAIMVRVADDAWGSSIDSDHLELFEVNINWVDTTQSSIAGPFNLPTPDYNSYMCGFNSLSCIPQPNTTKKLDPMGGIVMDKVQYRNFIDHESIVCSHIVNADGNGKAGVRWYELRNEGAGWYNYQHSTYSPDSDYRWMSSMAINDEGTIAMGYNISSSSVYPGANIVGRASCEELNMMTTDETVSVAGAEYSNSYRYGDYNNLVTDPTDGSFWFTANYNVTHDWYTKVSHFTISTCIATTVSDPLETTGEFLVSPVPVNYQLEVTLPPGQTESTSIQLIDVTGKTVLSKRIPAQMEQDKIVLDVHEINSGFYLVRLQTTKGPLVQQLIIQH